MDMSRHWHAENWLDCDLELVALEEKPGSSQQIDLAAKLSLAP
jgi:hypothetical protein